MKKLFLVLMVIMSLSAVSNAQVLKLIATDTFYGAGEGALLWTGSYLISDGGIEKGLGSTVSVGIFLGLGMGIYDSYLYSHNGNPYRDGKLTEAGTSMQIIGMDTFYGGAIGGVLGVAIALLNTDEPFFKYVGKGAGYGIWTGAVFGVVDAVVLSKSGQNTSASLINYKSDSFSLSGISPGMSLQSVSTLQGPKIETVPQINLLHIMF